MPDRTTLYDRDGNEFRTGHPQEIARLRARGYSDKAPTEAPSFEQQQFHPADAKIDDVLAYLRENPQDAGRVISEEKATAKPRKTIVEFNVLRDTSRVEQPTPDGTGNVAGVPDPGAPVDASGTPDV